MNDSQNLYDPGKIYEPAWEDVEQYFKFLGEENELYSLCWMGDDRGVLQGYGSIISDLPSIPNQWTSIKEYDLSKHPTLHITLNQTDLQGRRKENIKASRVLCLDLDRQIDEAELHDLSNQIVPHLIVSSSPNKYHLYWKITGFPLGVWELMQAGLAYLYGGDLELSGITHLIRVPGFTRVCKDGTLYKPYVVWLEKDIEPLKIPTKVEDFESNSFDWLMAGPKGLKALRDKRSLAGKQIKQLVQGGTFGQSSSGELAAGAKIEAGNRNNSLYMALKDYLIKYIITELMCRDCGEQVIDSALVKNEASKYAFKVNEHFEPCLNIDEVHSIIKSASRNALETAEKRMRERQAKELAAIEFLSKAFDK